MMYNNLQLLQEELMNGEIIESRLTKLMEGFVPENFVKDVIVDHILSLTSKDINDNCYNVYINVPTEQYFDININLVEQYRDDNKILIVKFMIEDYGTNNPKYWDEIITLDIANKCIIPNPVTITLYAIKDVNHCNVSLQDDRYTYVFKNVEIDDIPSIYHNLKDTVIKYDSVTTTDTDHDFDFINKLSKSDLLKVQNKLTEKIFKNI